MSNVPIPFAEPPQWWQNFVLMVDRIIFGTYDFLATLSAYEYLYVGFGVWFLMMTYWVNKLIKKLAPLYWVFLVVYWVGGFVLIRLYLY